MQDVALGQLGLIPRDTALATSAIVARQQTFAQRQDSGRPSVTGFIPVTQRQWVAVLGEAGLPNQVERIDELVAATVELRTASGRVIGKRLPGLLRELAKAANCVADVADEVLRFRPPRGRSRAHRMITDLAEHTREAVTALFECGAAGWEATSWAAMRHSLLAARLAGSQLQAEAGSDDLEDPDEDGYRWVLGLSSEQLNRGDGVAWKARLMAAYSGRQETFEYRLRRSMRHLIDDSVPMTEKLVLDLATLALSELPFSAHRAALQARDLVAGQLRADARRTSAVIAQGARREPDMLFAHRSQVAFARDYKQASHPEDRARAAMDLYRAVLEGSVKPTARAVLQLLGRTSTSEASLAVIRDLLIAESEPFCHLLASTVQTEWRNAGAHEEFRRDPLRKVIVLRGGSVEPEQVFEDALRARVVCRSFEHGVAVAYAANSSLVTRSSDAENYVGRDFEILGVFGRLGLPLDDLRRDGSTLMLHAAGLTIATVREFCRAVLTAVQVDPGVERWEIHSASADLPVFVLEGPGLAAGLALAAGSMNRVDPLPAAELPLLAGALTAVGEPPAAVSSTVLAIATTHIVGESDRLAKLGVSGAQEWQRTVRLVSQGVAASATLLENPGQWNLLVFVQVLAMQESESLDLAPTGLAALHAYAVETWRQHAPARLPWLR